MSVSKKRLAPAAIAVMAVTAVLLLIISAVTVKAADSWTSEASASLSGEGTSSSPYLISSAEDLAYLAKQVNSGTNFSGKYFKLTCDIDLSGHSWEAIGYYSYNDSGFSDGDSSVHLFSGTFDGNGHTIKNITINDTATMRSQGLFGYSDGTIENLSVDCNIAGYSYVGGVCGYSAGTVSNCYSSGSVSTAATYSNMCVGGICGRSDKAISKCGNAAAVSGSINVGGVCGKLSNTQMTGCWNKGNVSGCYGVGGVCGIADNAEISYCWNIGDLTLADGDDYTYKASFGGVCGELDDSTMEYCYNKGSINADTKEVGGVVGGIRMYSSSSTTVSKCYNTGRVTGNQNVGGVAGNVYSGSALQDCYNTGDVNGTTNNSGGVVGSDNGTVKNCYSTGTVAGTSNVGGVFGESSSARNCYYLTGTASAGVGNNGVDEAANNINALSASDFTSTSSFIGFDFTSTWTMGASRPLLRGMEETTLNGFGTQESPYIISDLATLKAFRDYINAGNGSGKYFMQTADIDISSVTNWEPIGTETAPFAGTYLGSGHVIKNISITGTSDNCGFFGYNSGTIEKLGLVGGSVSGNENVGGICGYNNTGTIKCCYNTAEVNGANNVGGICGYQSKNGDNGNIENCYNTGKVSGENSVGGICGQFFGTVTKCFSSAEVSGSTCVGSVVGTGDNPSNCYYNKDICSVRGNNGSDNGAVGITTAELCALPSSLSSTVWTAGGMNGDITLVSEGSRKGTAEYTLPSLKGVGSAQTVSGIEMYNFGIDGDDWDSYKSVSTAAELQAMNNDLSGNYVLENDIDWSQSGTNSFAPVGNASTQFTGKFSGDGHVIKNLKTESSSEYAGLFGLIKQGLIMNVGIEGGTVSGKNAGGVCGGNIGGTIYCCYNTADVTGSQFAGGVCGISSFGRVSNNEVIPSYITNCYNTGDISCTDTASEFVGGICGGNEVAYIKNCYSAGSVSGAANIGGICGNNPADELFADCYYNTDLCETDNGAGTGLTTLQMTYSDALTNMSGLGSLWARKDIDKAAQTAYYPYLKEFGEASSPEVSYETKLAIEQVIDADKVAVYGDKLAFKVSALVKFDGMEDYSADETALTENGGTFKITYASGTDTVTAVAGTDIPDNTSVTKETASGVDLTGEQIPFTLTYDGLGSEYFADGTDTAECNVDIEKKTLTADDFDFTAPSDLTYDGSAKTAAVTPKSTTTGVTAADITVRYFDSTGTTELTSSPAAPGTYTVKIDVRETEIYKKATALAPDTNSAVKWEFEIVKGTLTADDFDFAAPSDLTYDGSAKTAAVTPKSTTTGVTAADITVRYFDSTGTTELTSSPAAPGTYTVKIDVRETEIYKKATALAPDTNSAVKWEFEIVKAELTWEDLDFTAPLAEELVYDGNKKEANVSVKSSVPGTDGISITVKYYDSLGTELSDKPSAPGTYSVKIDYTGNANYESASDITHSSWKFTITSASVEAGYFTFTAPSPLDYDGTPKVASVTSDKEGIGEMIVKYYDSEGTQLASAPTVPGTYYVKIDTVDGTNYAPVTDFAPTPNTWTFTIEKGTLSASGTAKASGTYGQTLSQFSFTEKPAVTIGSGTAQTTVEGTWSFVNGSAKPVVGDTSAYRAKFTPSSNADFYNELTYDFAVDVAKADAVTIAPITQSYNWAAKGVKSVTVSGLPTDMGNVTPTVTVSDTNNILKPSSESYANGKVSYELSGFDSERYDISAVITVTLESDNYEDITFTVTVSITKKNAQTSTAECELTLTAAADSTYTAVITPVAGAEYRFNDDAQWSSNNTLTGIGHDTEVTGYIRMAATDTTDPGTENSATKTTGHGTLTHHEAKKPDTTHTGNIEYWSCDICRRYFKDSEGRFEISLEDTIIPARGTVSNGTNPDDNVLHADLDLTDDEIIDKLLTDEEKERIENGEDLVVYLVVIDYSPNVTDAERALMESVLKKGMNIGMYLDIKVYKQIGDDERTLVDTTNGPIKITFEMPSELLNTDSTMMRTYYMGHIHNGSASLLTGEFDSKTNKYSFYSSE
ncbi:MAG: GLUG motif-containing protein, partial [Oscillospiraceae bacterium]